MTNIKILTTNGKTEKEFIRELEEYVFKGWEMKGNLFIYENNIRAMIHKNVL